MTYDSHPITKIAESLNLERAPWKEAYGKKCYFARLGGVIEVAVYLDEKGRLYLRALDLVHPQVRVDPDEADDEGCESFRKSIHQWCIRFDDSGTPSVQSLQIRKVYREIVGQEDAPVSFMFSCIGGQKGRTTGKFVAIEVLPYLLRHLIVYHSPPDPKYEPAWVLLRAIAPFAGIPFSSMKEKTRQRKAEQEPLTRVITRAGLAPRQANAAAAPAPPLPDPAPSVVHHPQDLAQALTEARVKVQMLTEMRQEDSKKYKEKVDEFKELQGKYDALWKRYSQVSGQRVNAMTQGQVAENVVIDLFRDNAPLNCRISSVRHLTGHADIMITYRNSEGILLGYALVDVKGHLNTVSGEQVAKLESDIDTCTAIYGSHPIWAAVMSLYTGISHQKSYSLDYIHKRTPVYLVRSMMLSGLEDSAADTVRHFLALGNHLLTCMGVNSSGTLNVETMVSTELAPRSQVQPSLAPRSSMRTDYVTRTVLDEPVVTTTQQSPVSSQVAEAEPTPMVDDKNKEAEEDPDSQAIGSVSADMQAVLERATAARLKKRRAVPLPPHRRQVLDVRVFRDAADFTDAKYHQAVLLNRIIMYQEGAVTPTIDVVKRLATALQVTTSSTRRIMNDLCVQQTERRRFFTNITFREPEALAAESHA